MGLGDQLQLCQLKNASVGSQCALWGSTRGRSPRAPLQNRTNCRIGGPRNAREPK